MVDHDGTEYPRPVNGNSIWHFALHLLIVSKMWAASPEIVQREKHAAAKVTKNLIQKTKSLAKTGKAVAPPVQRNPQPPVKMLWLHLVPPGLGNPQARGGFCSRATGRQGCFRPPVQLLRQQGGLCTPLMTFHLSPFRSG